MARAVTNAGGIVERTATEDESTWTLLITTPKGITCIFGAGEGWQPIKFKKPEEAM